jgi:phosphoglucosamine mutase
VLRVLEEEGRRLSELLDEIPSYPLLREKVPCGPGEREERMGRLRERMGELRGISAVEEVDGLRISFEGGSWVLVRPSGTEPCLRVTCEAGTEEEARRRMREVLSLLG